MVTGSQIFMFQLTQEKKRCSRKLWPPHRFPNLPFGSTEHGAVMLASVLNSDKAKEVNIQIVRIFTRIREMALTNKDILFKIEQLEKKAIGHDEEIKMIFEALKKLLNPPQEPRQRIGFKP